MSMLVPMTNRLFPWNGLRSLEDELERVFRAPTTAPGAWMPAMDIHENKDAFEIVADLPGLKREEIELTVLNDVVTIKGERKIAREQNYQSFHRVERHQGRFERSWRLAGGIDAGKVEAHFEDGVLKVTLPKPEATKPKQIEVHMN